MDVQPIYVYSSNKKKIMEVFKQEAGTLIFVVKQAVFAQLTSSLCIYLFVNIFLIVHKYFSE